MVSPLLAAAIVCVDPSGVGGLVLRARHGPARQRLLSAIEGWASLGLPLRRLPAGCGEDRLLGGLDLAATLERGRPVVQRGVMAEAHGGVVIAAMAERMERGIAAHLAGALDRREVMVERDGFAARHPARLGVIALDEGIEPDERPPAVLVERLGLWVALDEAVGDDPPLAASDIMAARARLGGVTVLDDAVRALAATAAAFGIASLRAPLFAVAAARAHAALRGVEAVETVDLAAAAALALAPRATRLPATDEAAPADEPPPPPPPDANDREPGADKDRQDKRLDDVVIEATRAAIPEALLAGLAAEAGARARAAGGAGAVSISFQRGRPLGARRGDPRRGARLALIETLRAAAPWQPVRRAQGEARVVVERDDMRVRRFREEAETVTLFVVDASGSAALHRLAEAKGAVERLLADCYVRRDKVAVIAFRGDKAEMLLPPTRSLVRARRRLAGLPGGGGTPLSAAIDAATLAVRDATRRGATAIAVFLTDGKANIARSGLPDRARAHDDALASARAFAGAGARALFVDTSPRPQPQARAVADAMRATYLPLPHANAPKLDRAVRDAAAGRGG